MAEGLMGTLGVNEKLVGWVGDKKKQ
jgi:hypothetical protein